MTAFGRLGSVRRRHLLAVTSVVRFGRLGSVRRRHLLAVTSVVRSSHPEQRGQVGVRRAMTDPVTRSV